MPILTKDLPSSHVNPALPPSPYSMFTNDNGLPVSLYDTVIGNGWELEGERSFAI